MTAVLRRASVPADTAARNTVRQRGGLLVSVGFYLIVASVISALWRAAAHAKGGEIGGYTAAELTWYLVMGEAVLVCITNRLIEEVGDVIASGGVAVEMLRPVRPVVVRIASEAGRSLTKLAAILGAGFVLAWVLVGPPPSVVALMVAVPAAGLAVVTNLCLQHAVASMSFWVRDARSGWFIYTKLVLMVGGTIFPLEVMPGGLRQVAMVLPFQAMAYTPARLASGHVEHHLLAIQVGWLAALAGLAVALFARGQRRLQVVGG